MLLIIPGGPQDAGVFADISRLMADRYTVVAYDPRGNSRSAFDGEATGAEGRAAGGRRGGAYRERSAAVRPMCSGRAAARRSGSISPPGIHTWCDTLVAHEPPAIMMLPDPSEAIAADRDLHETYLREGVDAAMAKFFAMNGLEGEGRESDGPPEFDMPPEAQETFARVSGNFEYWLAHGMLPLSLYEPKIETLRKGKPRIVIGLGEQSKGQPIYEMGTAVAEKLGIEPVIFPGDHMGFESDAEAFV